MKDFGGIRVQPRRKAPWNELQTYQAFLEENLPERMEVSDEVSWNCEEKKGVIVVPDSFKKIPDGQTFEAIEIGGDILFLSSVDRERLSLIHRLTEVSIKEHRKSLEGLSK